MAEQMVHHGGQLETETFMKNHRHHLGAELHHLDQKTDLFAFVGQTLTQHVTTFRVKRQIVYF